MVALAALIPEGQPLLRICDVSLSNFAHIVYRLPAASRRRSGFLFFLHAYDV